VKELQSFLGFINFYRRFVKDFSSIATNLYDLTRNERPFVWKEEHTESFHKLKQQLNSSVSLRIVDLSKPFRMETDASIQGIGAVLYQPVDGNWEPIAFESRVLTSAEKKYPTHELELLAVIHTVKPVIVNTLIL
jgi:hypothetical protein